MAVTRKAIGWLVPVLCVAACQGGQVTPDEPGSPLTPEEQVTIARYLSCIDCVIPLDSVRALALRKPEATVDSLNVGLVRGPGPRAVAIEDSLLAIGYVRDSAWRVLRRLPILPVRDVYIPEERDRYVNGYRSRGAIGMGYIHTPRAVAHLDSALTLQLPPTVLRAVRYARDSLPRR